MKLSEAKKILKSSGYRLDIDAGCRTECRPDYIGNTVRELMESLESRNATRTKSYAILSEMSRFAGRYTGSFAGLEDAGTVELSVRGNAKEFGVAEALSKIENDFKSANSKGARQETAVILLSNYETALAAVPETANAEYIEELKKEKRYIEDCVEAGDGIPVGGWTEEGLARTTHSRDDSALDAKDLISKIGNQITSLKKGGKNYDLIKARIDMLLSRADELTAEERAKAEDLYVKLDLAGRQAKANAVASDKIAIFKPNDGINPIRIKAPLNNNNIPFTVEEDGTYIITKKVDLAKELLSGRGEFITPDTPAARRDNSVVLTFENVDDADAVMEDVLPDMGIEGTQDGSAVTINGTAAQIRRVMTRLYELEITFTEA